MAGEIIVEQAPQRRQGQLAGLEDLGADDLQRIGQVGEAHERAFHPVGQRAAVVDVAGAADAVAREQALQRFASEAAAILAEAALMRDGLGDGGAEPLEIGRQKGVVIGGQRPGIGLRGDLVEQQAAQAEIGRGDPDVAASDRRDLDACRIDVVAGVLGRQPQALQAAADDGVVEECRRGAAGGHQLAGQIGERPGRLLVPAHPDGGIDQPRAAQGLQAQVRECVGGVAARLVGTADHHADGQAVGHKVVDQQEEILDQQQRTLAGQCPGCDVGVVERPQDAVEPPGANQPCVVAVLDAHVHEPEQLQSLVE